MVGVADHDLNKDSTAKETITIAVKSDHGEIENVVLTESGVNTSRFTGTLEAKVSNDAMTNDDDKFLLNKNTNLTATYVDSTYGTQDDPETLEAVLSIEVAETPTDSTDSNVLTSDESNGFDDYGNRSLLMMIFGFLGIGAIIARRKLVK